MRRVRLLGLTLGIVFASYAAYAQLQYLRLSPAQAITQRVGATDVTVALSRPQARGRTIFGGLVPYGELWRTGANENTKVSLSHRVNIGGTVVQAGTYALFTTPGQERWDIYFYTDTANLDVPDPVDSTKLIYLTTVDAETLDDPEETLVVNVYDITETSANLGIAWGRVAVKVPMTFYTHEAMELMIDEELERNVLDLSIAASYYRQRDRELERARKLQELAMELRGEPNAWDLNSYGVILRKLGERAEAVAAIRESLGLATASGNAYLVQENERLLSEWGKPATTAEPAGDARAPTPTPTTDEQLILEALNGETVAAFTRDYAAWREHWVHAPYVFKVYMDLRDSTMSEDRGWAPVDEFVRTYIEEHPEPDPLPAPLTDAEVRVYGTGAYVEYEQLDPGRGRKREIRLMEKHGGRWKIAGMRTVIYEVGE